jgi:hypothetical protein
MPAIPFALSHKYLPPFKNETIQLGANMIWRNVKTPSEDLVLQVREDIGVRKRGKKLATK